MPTPRWISSKPGVHHEQTGHPASLPGPEVSEWVCDWLCKLKMYHSAAICISVHMLAGVSKLGPEGRVQPVACLCTAHQLRKVCTSVRVEGREKEEEDRRLYVTHKA